MFTDSMCATTHDEVPADVARYINDVGYLDKELGYGGYGKRGGLDFLSLLRSIEGESAALEIKGRDLWRENQEYVDEFSGLTMGRSLIKTPPSIWALSLFRRHFRCMSVVHDVIEAWTLLILKIDWLNKFSSEINKYYYAQD